MHTKDAIALRAVRSSSIGSALRCRDLYSRKVTPFPMPLICISAGIIRSGSTWAYNVCRELGQMVEFLSGVRADPRWKRLHPAQRQA
jgi:hypothetical protein